MVEKLVIEDLEQQKCLILSVHDISHFGWSGISDMLAILAWAEQ